MSHTTAQDITSRQPARLAPLYLVCAALLWSTGGLLVKLSSWSPLSVLAGRGLVAASVLLVYLRGTRLRLNITHYIGAVALLATQILFILATRMTTAANAIFLQYTSPLYVVPLGIWLLGEHPRRIDWITMAILFLGLAFFFGDRLSADGLTGNLLALLSGFTVAVFTIVTRHLGRCDGGSDAAAQVILLSYGFAAVVGFPSLLGEAFTPRDIGLILLLGVFQIGLAFMFYARAIPYASALEATLITMLEPILNPLWVALVLGERPGPRACLGALLVVGGVVLRSLTADRQAPDRDT